MEIKRTIDHVDLQILHILQDRVRVPNAEVARRVGMAPSAVLERIRKLEERGIIEGYEVRLNPHHFGQGLAAFIQVEASRAGNGRLAGELASIRGVQEVHQVAGEDGYLVKVRVADSTALGCLLRDDMAAIRGVRRTRTLMVLDTVKETRRIQIS